MNNWQLASNALVFEKITKILEFLGSQTVIQKYKNIGSTNFLKIFKFIKRLDF